MSTDATLRAQVLAAYRDFGEQGGSMNELVYALGSDAPPRKELRRMLKTMCRQGDIVRLERDLYAIATERGDQFEGRLKLNNGQFWVKTKDGSVQIPSQSLGEAIVGDDVRGAVTIKGEPAHGIIESVVKENVPREVVVQVTRFRGMYIGESEELEEPLEIVGRLPEGVRPGSFMRVKIVDRRPFRRGAAPGFPAHALVGMHPDAVMAERRQLDKERMLRFVDPDELDARTVLDQLARGLGADAVFPPEALAQANAAQAPTRPDEAGDDVTHLPLATIDGADAKDFDDAVYAEQRDGNIIRLWVAIADVSSYVEEGSTLDIEARRRGCSVYLPGRVYPMLPPHISDDICSLRPDVLRRCSYTWMDIGGDGRVLDYGVGFGVMRSRARLTYDQVHAFFEGETLEVAPEIVESLKLLDKVRARRYEYRRDRGMLDLDLPEPQVRLSADGRRVEQIEPSPRWEANRLIEECMLVANETVAAFLLREGWPTIYRVHGEPDPKKVASLRQVLKDVAKDTKVPADPTPNDLERVLESVAGTDASRVLSWLVLRVLPRAEYSVQRAGHYGLGADLYLHYTSPIRRYPDLEVHRMMRRALEAGRSATPEEREVLVSRLTESAELSNQGESIQTTAERTSDKMMRALHMREHVGDRFPAVISDVARFGLFVSVTHPYVEGLVPIQSLGDEYFEHDTRRSRLVGERTRTAYQVGGTVEVICTSVDVRKGNVGFELVGTQQRRKTRGGRPAKARRSGPKKSRR